MNELERLKQRVGISKPANNYADRKLGTYKPYEEDEEEKERKRLESQVEAIKTIAQEQKPIDVDEVDNRYKSHNYREYSLSRIEKDYNKTLVDDINNTIAYKKGLGMTDKEIQEGFIPKNNDPMSRLADIEKKIKQGEERGVYRLQEGYLQKQAQGILSEEANKEANGLPSKRAEVNKWMQDHPELELDTTKDKGFVEKSLDSGIRFMGEMVQMGLEGTKRSVKEPLMWGTVAAIWAGSLMLAPVTGGASLFVPATATAAWLGSATALTALGFGMTAGRTKYMADLEAGLAYNEYVESGVNPEIAKPIAETVGALNGILESMQFETMVKAVPGVNDLAKRTTGLAKNELSKKLLKIGTAYGVDLGGNVLEEMMQESNTNLGATLSAYMQEAPNPNTVDGLKLLTKTMTSEEHLARVAESGVQAAMSMWLMPIGSSVGGYAVNRTITQLEQSAAKKAAYDWYTEEEKQTKAYQDEAKKVLPYAVEVLAKDAADNKSEDSVKGLTAVVTILEEVEKRPDLSNEDKAKISETKQKANEALAKVEYDVKSENPEIELATTNKQEIEQKILSGELPRINTNLTEVVLELRQKAQDKGIYNVIYNGLLEGKRKIEISAEVEKLLPRKERNAIEIMQYINSVEIVEREIKYQFNAAKIANLMSVKDSLKTKAPEQPTTNETKVSQPTDSLDTENLATVNVEPVEGNDTVTPMPKEPLEVNEGKFAPTDAVKVPVKDIHLDPKTFQFRFNGTTNKMEGVQWNDKLAGTILLWENEYGDLYVVNGHHRVMAAKENNVSTLDAKILRGITAQEARAEGAILNIAEGSADAFDTAKFMRDTNSSLEDLTKLGVPPKSKIARDGANLAKLEDNLFYMAAVKKIPYERAVMIGKELGEDKIAQRQFYDMMVKEETKRGYLKDSTIEAMLSQVKSAGGVEYFQESMLGNDARSAIAERAELVSYVKDNLKNKKSVLKKISKAKNIKMLEQLGNKINAEDNVEQMELADQALYLLDKTVNAKDSKVSKMFNELAMEYAKTGDKKMLDQAMKMVGDLMESGELLQEAFGKDKAKEEIVEALEEQIEGQVDLFGMTQIKEMPSIKVKVNKGADKNTQDTLMPLIEIMEKNPMFNGLEIIFTGQSSDKFMDRSELDAKGYHNAREGIYRTYGWYESLSRANRISERDDAERTNQGNSTGDQLRDNRDPYKTGTRGRIFLNNSAQVDTLLHETIHSIQDILYDVDPEFAVLVAEWEKDINAEAEKQGIVLPQGREMLTHALMLGEFGYADDDMSLANTVAVPKEIVKQFRDMLGKDFADEAMGENLADAERKLKADWKKYADGNLKTAELTENVARAKQRRISKIKMDLKEGIPTRYYSPDSTTYAIAMPKGTEYEVSFFNEQGLLTKAKLSINELAKKLSDMKLYYNPSEISYQLKQWNRDQIDDVVIGKPINDPSEIVRAFENARIGNFTASDYDNYVKDMLNEADKQDLLKAIMNAAEKGLDKPNSEVTIQEYVNRFYPQRIEPNDYGMRERDGKIEFFYKAYDEMSPYRSDEIVPIKVLGTFDSVTEAIKAYRDWTYLNRDLSAYKDKAFNKQFYYMPDYWDQLVQEYEDFKANYETYRHDYSTDFDGQPKFNVSYQIKKGLSDTKRINPEAGEILTVVYKGFKDGETKRIKTGNSQWDSFFFVADNPLDASLYGNTLEEYSVSPKAKILYEGTKEFSAISKHKKNETMLEWSSRIANTAKEQGYDAVWFKRQGEIGTAVINREILSIPDNLKNYQLKAAIDTEEFKTFFGKSVAVDEEGSPLTVYHGSPNQFNEFSYKFMRANGTAHGVGFYLTNNKEIAESYSEEGGMLFEGYVRIEKPLSNDRLTIKRLEVKKLLKALDPTGEGNHLSNYGDVNYEGYNSVLEKAVSMLMEYNENDVDLISDIINTGGGNWQDDYMRVTQLLGYDGIVVDKGDGVKYFIPFLPTQIKSVYNDGTFSLYDPNINYQLKSAIDVEGFYSNLEKVLDEKMGSRGKAQDILNMLNKNGVKPEELEWFRIADFLADKDFVTKEEILEHMQERRIEFNKIDMGTGFQECTLHNGQGGSNYRFNAYTYDNNPGRPFIKSAHFGDKENVIAHTRYMDRTTQLGEKVLFIEEMQSDWHQEGRDKGYAKYVTPEVQKSINEKRDTLRSRVSEITTNMLSIYNVMEDIHNSINTYKNKKQLLSRIAVLKNDAEDMGSSAMIEQVSKDIKLSDWYFNELGGLDGMKNKLAELKETYKRLKEEKRELLSEIQRLKLGDPGIPDAPLKDSITDFMFKTAIKDAVEGGYDRIAWTTGEQQADRYNVRKVADRIEWRLSMQFKNVGDLVGFDVNGKETFRYNQVKETDLEELLGKGLANELITQEMYEDQYGYDTRALEKEGLEIGGEFHKKLYNNYIPRMVKKYAKKWGISPEVVTIQGGEVTKHTYEQLMAMDILDTVEVAEELGIGDEARGLLDIVEVSRDYPNQRLIKSMQEKVTNLILNHYDNGLNTEQLSIPVTPQMIEDVMSNGQPLFQIKELVAVHNLSEGQLKSTVKLGGIVMPSIAVTLKNYLHDRYGEISLLFNKNTIDPRANKDNRVYSGDAYTPEFPSIRYKINDKEARTLRDRVKSALAGTQYMNEYRDTIDATNIEDRVNREGSFEGAYKYDPLLMLTYLKEKGIEFEPVMRTKNYEFDVPLMEQLQAIEGELINKQYLESAEIEQLDSKFREAINKFYGVNLYKEAIGYGKMDRLHDNIREFSKDTTRETIDGRATETKLQETIDHADYTKWFNEVSKDIIEAEGIRNNRDIFTNSGTRRGWNALHDPVTLDNILKAMKAESETASGMLGGVGRFGAAVSRKFTSIADIKAAVDRLSTMDEEVYNAMREDFQERLIELASRIKDNRESNRFIAIDHAFDAMVDAFSNGKGRSGIVKILNEYPGLNITEDAIDEMMQLADEVAQMPTEYFEAKPRRIVGLEEIQAVIMPLDTDPELVQMLRDRGIHLIEFYDKAIEGDRQRAMDEVLGKNDVSFQIKPESPWNANTIDEYYQLKDNPEMEERSWSQTVRDANLTQEWLRDMLTDRKMMYEVAHNEDSMIAGAKLIDERGIEYIEARLDNDFEATPDVMAAGMILIYYYQESGDRPSTHDMVAKVAKKATTAGQAIQILSYLNRESPEGILRFTRKEFDKQSTSRQRKTLEELTKKVEEEAKKVNSETVDTVDVEGLVKKVQDMTQEELDTIEIAQDDQKTQDFMEGKEVETNQKSTVEPEVIAQVIKDHYKGDGKRSLVSRLRNAGMNPTEAKLLSDSIEAEMLNATDAKVQEILDRLSTGKAKAVDKSIKTLISQGRYGEALKLKLGQKKGVPVLTDEMADMVYQRAEEISKMPEGREKNVQLALLLRDIDAEMPVGLAGKITTFRIMMMLLNAVTMLRNIIGNLGFGAVDTFALNVVGAEIDKLYAKNSGFRTTLNRGLDVLSKQWQGYGTGGRIAYEDAKLGIDTNRDISRMELGKTGRTFARGTVLGSLETALNIGLRVPDAAAMYATSFDTIQEQIEIAGVAEPTQEMLDIAHNLGLYRTFNDDSLMSEAFKTIKNGLNIVGTKSIKYAQKKGYSDNAKWTQLFGPDPTRGSFGFGDIVLPFTKTVANLTQRAIDYSPAGVILTMAKLYLDHSQSDYVRQRMKVEAIARGITGTALIGTGMLLAQLGVIRGGDPEDEDKDVLELQKQAGLRPYTINLSAISRVLRNEKNAGDLRPGDQLATYDWLQPGALTIAIGADIATGDGDTFNLINTLVRAMEVGSETVTGQPLLQNVTKIFEWGINRGLTNTLKSLPASFIPSVLGRVAQAADGGATDPYSYFSEGRQAWNLIANKLVGDLEVNGVPLGRGAIPDKIDIMGEPIKWYGTDDQFTKYLQALFSPAIMTDYTPTEEMQFLIDLTIRTGDSTIIQMPQRTFTEKGVSYEPTPEQFEAMSIYYGKALQQDIKSLMQYGKGRDDDWLAKEVANIVRDIKGEVKFKFIRGDFD